MPLREAAKVHAVYFLAFAVTWLLAISLFLILTKGRDRKVVFAATARRTHAFGGNSEDFCRGLSWLHIPKTSSTMCLTLQHICCKKGFQITLDSNANLSTALYSYTNYTDSRHHASNPYNTTKRAIIDGELLLHTKQVFLSGGCASIKNGDNETRCRMDKIYSGHKPLNQSRTRSYRRFIVLFRDPLERLISSYVDSFHHEGMDDTEYRAIFDLRNNRTSGAHCSSAERCFVAGYVYMMTNWRRVHSRGCQVKMMNGYSCFQSVVVTQAMVDNAVNLISNNYMKSQYDGRGNVTFYSGVFERYNESIRYFHHVAGKGTAPLPIEFVKFRESAGRDKGKASKELLRRINRDNNYSDPYDTVLYERANQILNDNVRILNE